jgi:hypothetical protein
MGSPAIATTVSTVTFRRSCRVELPGGQGEPLDLLDGRVGRYSESVGVGDEMVRF